MTPTTEDHCLRSNFRPVIILGAGRSGTNLLRNGMTSFAGVGTWPCDEVNYLWRTGNARHPTDELTASLASPKIRKRIRDGFEWVTRHTRSQWVVEKTCANTLRVGFVDKVIPDARYLHITRDGYDVTASAMKRWGASIEFSYLLKKTRFVPLGDLPHYGWRFLRNQFRRHLSEDRALSTWGPRFEGLDELRVREPLAVVCATQWRRCVDSASEALRSIPDDRIHSIQYEQLVSSPESTLSGAAEFLGIEPSPNAIKAFAHSISKKSIGAGRRSLNLEEIASIEPIIERPHIIPEAAA
ncbi:hypothetical protein MalM25_26400 [Planctomycetes bacterium MalM25]|nr:hypothetical protein MalM25_26400 [Planctomycetes bacterium MalM25]